MAIEIHELDLPQVQGEPGTCDTRNVVRVSHRFTFASLLDRWRQGETVDRVRVVGKFFQLIPCEAHLQVGAREGTCFFRGTVQVCSPSARACAEEFIEIMLERIEAFVADYPHSWFTVTVQQEIHVREP